MSWTTLLTLSLLAAVPGQAATPADAEADALGSIFSETAIVVPPLDLDDGWLELTHLGSEAPPRLVRLGRRREADGELVVAPGLPPGPVMVCSGGRPWGVTCERAYRGGGEHAGLPRHEVSFEPGLAVRGVYRQDLEPAAGARVALVPAALATVRAYTLPLAVAGGRAVREVATADDGSFALPAVAAGDYFLETVLPSGRVHRTDAFAIPDRQDLRRLYEVDDRDADDGGVTWDLGVIDVATGLDVAVRALDPTGAPIRGAAVTATQGRTPREVLEFAGFSDAEGRVDLHGLDVELPVRLACDAAGYRPFAAEYELLPVAVDCVLEPWARVTGEVIGPDGQAPRGATVAVRPLAANAGGREAEPAAVAVAADGAFELGELAAGDYELTAAAPGFRVEERTFTVDFGARSDLGAILLLFASEIAGVVIDAATGEPLAGVDVRAVTPPGAVAAFSDVDGEFRFAAGSDNLELELSAFDYAPRRLTVTPEEVASGQPLVVELVAAGWILAVVEAADGSPCQGCRVVIWPGGEELWTDALGEALSGPLGAGAYRVDRPRVTHLGSTVVEHPEADVHRLRVTPGRLSVARFAAAERTVRVRFEPRLDGLWTLSARTRRRSEKHFPEPDGAFEVGQRAGEGLDLFLHAWDEELGAEIAVWQGKLAAGALVDEVTLRLSGSLVSGRARGLDGPLAGAEVRLLSFADAELRAVVYTYPDGRFRIPHVRPGVYALYVGARNVKFVAVGERQTVDLGTFELFFDDAGL